MTQNEPISSLTHFAAFLLSIAGLVLLVVFASLYGRPAHIVGFSIFGSALMLLYFSSALYHFISKTHALKNIFRKIDHAMIYILIAATYTPLALAIPQRGWGWSIFGIVWGLASLGIMAKLVKTNEKKWLSPILYIAMGWFIIIALPILIKTFSPIALFWLFLGGLLYTSGVIFFALEKLLPKKGLVGMHEIFHLFVMGGSFSHFWFMFKYVLYI